MGKYNNPLLQEVDFSQAKEPAMEMMLDLYQQQDSLDLNAYLTKPFETPLFNRVEAIQLDEENERFEFVRADGTTWDDFSLGKQAQYLSVHPGSDLFVITMADPTSGLVGGYQLRDRRNARLVFDRLLWEACGQPLDGRGFRMDCADCFWRPVVVGNDLELLLGDDRSYNEMVPYFPDQQTAEKLAAEFSLRSIYPQRYRWVSLFTLQVVKAVRQQPGWEKFSFADWQKEKDCLKRQLEDGPQKIWTAVANSLPLQAWGCLDDNGELWLFAQTPEKGMIYSDNLQAERDISQDEALEPFDLLTLYRHAKVKADFYKMYSKERLMNAIELVCACLGVRSNLKLKDVTYLAQWEYAGSFWFHGCTARLAQMLVNHHLKPFATKGIDGPNAHLLRDAEIDQWLPADFKITEQNQEGFLAFVHGLFYDLRDLTAEQAAEYFQQCLCSSQAQQVEFEKIDGEVQLLDLMEDGYFDRGSLSCQLEDDAAPNHAWRYYQSLRPWYPWSDDPLLFSWKEQVVLDGFVFRMPKSEEECGNARLYCGMKEIDETPLASGRIPPVIVSRIEAPRVPIGIVEPLSTDFELSGEFYQTLNESKEQFNERFQQTVEQYWEIFDKKYPYLY